MDQNMPLIDREHSDMLSASVGGGDEGSHGKADVVREVA